MSGKQKFGMTVKKLENFSEWYIQVVTRGELIDYYDIKGCFILRPSAMHIWSSIRRYFDDAIMKMGVQECSFPMLVTKRNLELEKSHLANFNPELAWVTKCGEKILEEPVALRPTSETIMYPSFAKWIKSYRDLPLRLNQWCSVMRWEVRSTLPFIRGREFLWQEGHMAFYCEDDAKEETYRILEIYERIYRDLLAVPVTKGIKSRKETFGGAEYTYSIEAFIPGSGKGIQAATSHYLGRNFAEIFGISVETESGGPEKEFVFQNSWGMTTRSIGIAAMMHSDDMGFVCPPRVALIQVVVIMCGIKSNTTAEERALLESYAKDAFGIVKKHCRAHFDERDNISPGYKFNHWEIRGVPLRMEIGFRDMANGTVCIVRRDTRDKFAVRLDSLDTEIVQVLDKMHHDMYTNAKRKIDERIVEVNEMDAFRNALERNCMGLVPWCEETRCEDEITENTTIYGDDKTVLVMGAKSLCIPIDGKKCENHVCLNCGKSAKSFTLFGRSY